MIQESASSLVQTAIIFSVRTLLSSEMTAIICDAYCLIIIIMKLIIMKIFRAKYSLRFVLFVRLVRKSVSKFDGNRVESLNRKTSLSETLLS